MINPITPEEAEKSTKSAIPPKVIEAFNELISQNYRLGVSVVKQSAVEKLILEKLSADRDDYTLRVILDNGWLDVEPLYKKAGWEVMYDRAGYNEEPYPPTYTFRRPR